MQIVESYDRSPLLVNQLVVLWEASVKKTHLFLSTTEIEQIKKYVPEALNKISHLVVAKKEQQIVAFMGIEGQKLEMLFVAPDERGKGIGKQLLEWGVYHYSVDEVVVNEQNPQAKGFYEHEGFLVAHRSAMDEQGNAYPILYMERKVVVK